VMAKATSPPIPQPTFAENRACSANHFTLRPQKQCGLNVEVPPRRLTRNKFFRYTITIT
jgi:hypothetical protein